MDVNVEEIYRWIDGFTISRPKRNIHRDFSDAVPLAEIIKIHFPKLVDLHNYSPKNALAQKIINWNILNKRVLAKLRIHLNTQQIEELAKSTPGAIEKLLFNVKQRVDEKSDKDNSRPGSDIYVVEGLSAQVTGEVVPIKVKSGSKILDQKIVPSDMYDNMKKDIEEKESAISTLKNKVEHLESLLRMKDERIGDLSDQIKRLSDTNNTSSGNRFLPKMFSTDK
ncbi:sperm flagellar protein 1-like [Onthophagus taurus]|uniref:sperm flagellar protein 1-like n=1 Tax=Onthophagus taurus TaxID=166361 RepID=UPI000C1FDF8A|nr:sperm flagellar protein 1-like [Onthophagus taurus]